MPTFNSINLGSNPFFSKIARPSDSSSRFLSGIKAPPRIGAIGDAHGSRTWIDWIEVLAPQVDKIVFTGDLLDRGLYNLEVVEKAKELHAKGRLIPLWGNHDLMFVMAMAGDQKSYVDWMQNGGGSVLREVGIDSSDPTAVFNQVIKSAQLKEISQWMVNKFKLYHVDEYNTLYMHAGIPLDHNGAVTLSYGGRQGLEALKLADVEMKSALQSGNINHQVFRFLQGNRSALLWNREWIEIAQRVGAERVLSQLGVDMFVFGHTIQPTTLNIGNRIFGIDRGMVSDEGAIWMRDDKGVAVDSVYGGERQEPIPPPLRIPPQEPRKNPPVPFYAELLFLGKQQPPSRPQKRLPANRPPSVNYTGPITIILSPEMNPVFVKIVKADDADPAIIKRENCFGFEYYIMITIDSQIQVFPILDGTDRVIGRQALGGESLPGSISRKHVQITRRGNTFTIVDLDSLNGTTID